MLGKVRRRLSFHKIVFAVKRICGSLNHESSAIDLIYDKAGLCDSASGGVWRSAGTLDVVLSPDPTRRLPRNLVVKEAPSAMILGRECPFYSRCPIRLDPCPNDVPAMAAVGSEHGAACLRPTGPKWSPRGSGIVVSRVVPVQQLDFATLTS